jgi:hypothetical protein
MVEAIIRGATDILAIGLSAGASAPPPRDDACTPVTLAARVSRSGRQYRASTFLTARITPVGAVRTEAAAVLAVSPDRFMLAAIAAGSARNRSRGV